MPNPPILLWFRLDLRLADHPALAAAVASGRPVIPVYILDDESPGRWKAGGASRWWLHHSLASLARSLEERGSRLILRRSEAAAVLDELAVETGAAGVWWTAGHEPFAGDLQRRVGERFTAAGREARRFGGGLLHEPGQLTTAAGTPFRVFTPFWRALQAATGEGAALAAPERLVAPTDWPRGDRLETWGLLPTRPDWAGGLRDAWTPGEAAAGKKLDAFVVDSLGAYAVARDRPDLPHTSRLSPHLHFGEISPQRCWRAAAARMADDPAARKGALAFQRELAWRDFSYHLLAGWPTLPDAPFRPAFADFPWRQDAEALERWQRGRTGYPLVDAGMRELWRTGWMHNRVRMVVASFLVKDLLLPWQDGKAWFWDTLVDADLANNAASWQWVAGSGADAAPYFRIFNPVLQGRTFDPEGVYVKRWLPELAGLPARHVHAPWEAPEDVLSAAGVALGQTYPRPIVDHRAARERALEAFSTLTFAEK